MDVITINNENYIVVDYLFETNPTYCKDARNSRELIKKKNIIDFIYAKKNGENWEITDGKSYKNDKVLIKKSLFTAINNDIQDDLIPEIINLMDSEKFKDINGNILNIETRGERSVDSIYFKVKDIINNFKLENLNKHIIDKKSYFIEGQHYIYFNCKKVRKNENKTKIKKEQFLTYEGLLRVLFASHSSNVKPFIKWATEKLFTIQLGTNIQKYELVGTLLGINAKTIKEVFNADKNILPCIYLFTLNTVSILRNSMNINLTYPDDSIVCKYGFTKDLSRRTGEHINKFGKIPNVELKLKYYSFIDPLYMANAESDIRYFMSNLNINFNYENNDELVIIPKNLLNLVEKQYQYIGKNYMSHISELVNKVKDLEVQLLIKNKDIELINEKYKNELQKKDIQLLNKEIEIYEFYNKKRRFN